MVLPSGKMMPSVDYFCGPRGIDPLGLVPEYLILHHSWERGVSQWLFYAIYNYTLMGTYFNFDDSRTFFSGRTVILYLGLVAEQTLWGDQKLWKMSLLFWMFLTKRNTFYFFLTNYILLSIGPGYFALGPWPREYRTYSEIVDLNCNFAKLPFCV